MKKIVIDYRMCNSSGIGTYIKNIVPYLVSKYEIILLGNKGDVKNEKYCNDVKVIEFRDKIYSIAEQLKYPFLIPECDVFWSPHYNVPILPVKAKKKIVTIHDVNHLVFYKNLSFFQKIYARIMLNTAVNNSNIIFTVSEFSKKEILKYLNLKLSKIYVIYPAINLEISNSKNLDNINLSDKYLLYVGNVKPHKNLKNLIFAYKKLKLKNIKLLIVGKKEGLITVDKSLFELIDKDIFLKQNVVFTGYVSDKTLYSLYNNALLFVFPSLYEGFGIPPLEAMACGCPCVVSNVASLPEVCGDAAYYVNPYDVNDIAKGIEKVLTDENLRQDLIRKGFENVKRFSWEKSASKILEVFGYE